jgi:hypothetical protein
MKKVFFSLSGSFPVFFSKKKNPLLKKVGMAFAIGNVQSEKLHAL